MRSELNESDLQTLENIAATAAAYLDACDCASHSLRIDPYHYQCCGRLLVRIFSALDPRHNFQAVLAHSPAAREVMESLEISQQLRISRLVYYPQLSLLMTRISS